MSDTDHIRIDFTSDVPEATRLWLLRELMLKPGIAWPDHTTWSYMHHDKLTGQLVIEITAHDRDTFDLTDGQVVERLRGTARQQGISVKELLRKLATE